MRLLRSVPLMLIASACAVGKADPDKIQAVREINRLEGDWIKMVVNRDSAGFDQLLDPRFTYTENDKDFRKLDVIRDVVTSRDTVTAGRNQDLGVTVAGNTAIATGWMILTGHGPGGAFERHYRFTDTWINTDGRWRVLAAQDFLKP